jgi:hypothetical protein
MPTATKRIKRIWQIFSDLLNMNLYTNVLNEIKHNRRMRRINYEPREKISGLGEYRADDINFSLFWLECKGWSKKPPLTTVPLRNKTSSFSLADNNLGVLEIFF